MSAPAEHVPQVERPVGEDPTWPAVTVVVPVHGDRGRLARTTAALAAQDYPGDLAVVVADNGDNPLLEEALAPLRAGGRSVRVVHEQRPGSYAARNAALAGLAPARDGEVVAFTDGDCLPRSDWARRAVEALTAADGPAFVGGAISLFPADAARPTAAELWDCANGLRQDHYVTTQGWAATANMVTTRAVLDAVGVFDDRLRSGGDREWGTRAVRAGVQALFSPDAVVDHPARGSMAELHTKVRRVTRGEVDTRRAQGRPMFDRGTLAGTVRPNTRSIVRTSERVSPRWDVARVRYVAVAHWLQYYFLAAKVGHVVSTRRAARPTSTTRAAEGRS